jgi:predicted enzyme related to lactoylglutathione lyase
MSDIDYKMFKKGDERAGGLMALTPEIGPAPPNWLVYISVGDCDATVEKTKSLGGNVLCWSARRRSRTSVTSRCCRIPSARCSP